MDASNDGSESVDQFLARIASLNSKQGQEEAERSKRMEEEMLQARKERQARRAERARSLSPSKTGPAPSSLRLVDDNTPSRSRGIDPPVALTPPLHAQTLGRSGSISPKPDRLPLSSTEFARPLPPPPFQERSAAPSPPANVTSLSRSGTLSWNQRPGSRGAGSLKSRPLSVASIPDAFINKSIETQNPPEEMSRKDIAASLATKDPTWFRQTADRGLGSAAYRKNEFDSETQTSFASRGVRLPGMSREPARNAERGSDEPQKPTPPPSPLKSATALTTQQLQDVEHFTTARPASMISLSSKSPTLDLPAFKPLDLSNTGDADTAGIGRTSSVLSSAGRPPSPTKGLGGFVQSAMMKRSDSVNKRWSVQANAGLKRGDSVATSRPAHLSGVAGFTPGHSRNSSRDNRVAKEGSSSPLSSSRPVSSHGPDPVPVTRGKPLPRPQDESAALPKDRAVSEEDDNSEKIPVANLSQNRPTTPPPPETLLSRSPSKTLDARRWSPTKASWLESALNKPDSPRFTPAKPETPAWKLSMQRSKEQQSHPPQSTHDSQKPAIAPKPLTSPSLTKTLSIKDNSLNNHAIKSAPAPVPIAPEKDEPTPSAVKDLPFSPLLSKDTQSNLSGKPTVPSKRNITPAKTEPRPDEQPSAQMTNTSQLPVDEVPTSSAQGMSSPEGKAEFKVPALKPKPQTPPKTDFRANLKARQAPSNANTNDEPEFKAVFGKLKRTQTQNYVAPDVLKDNITKGKAALNLTGGPQPTKRVDEFKESILQKKEAMKAAAGSVSKRPESTSTAKAADPVPEALARRVALHKTGPSSEKIEVKPAFSQQPAPPATLRELPLKPAPLKREPLASPESAPEKPPRSLSEDSLAAKPVATTIPEKKSMPALRKTVVNEKPAPSSTDNVPQLSSESSFKTKLPENSKLAARLNPALAGFLSRSGSPRLPGDAPSNTSSQSKVHEQDPSESAQNSSELTHTTKARAKGPKRRAPKAGSAPKESISSGAKQPPSNDAATPKPTPTPKPLVSRSTMPIKPAATVSEPSEQAAGTKPMPRKPSVNIQPAKAAEKQPEEVEQDFAEKRKDEPIRDSRDGVLAATVDGQIDPIEADLKPRPLIASKSPALRKVSTPPTTSKPTEITPSPKPATPKKFAVVSDRPVQVSSPPESDGEKQIPSLTPPTTTALPLTPSKSKLNTPKLKPSIENSTKPTSATMNKISGLGLHLESSSRKPATTPELTPPPEPETVPARARPLPPKPAPLAKSSSITKSQLETFFGPLPPSNEKAEFDTHAFLSSQNKQTEKPKTLSKQIWEVTGDGKRTALPSQQEYILFEDCMYLCVHTMQSSAGSKFSEVYLWCGDEVPEAAIEDAQLFCRKVARENSAKLEVVKQGKESSELFQALGGIVIIRKNKSSALYMLCGRRHLGHVAFDEVDFTASNLCSGRPFLISAKFGKLYLWKGAGSDQEDVGCARLIGMDLGLTGEIEEVSEGEESASFWESFPSGPERSKTPNSQKEAHKYRRQASRLYRVEHDRPKSSGGFWGLRASSPPKQSHRALVEEVSPFSQKDLDANHIHILDTYSDFYVIIGSSAKKPAEFVTAVQIAQEMAMLSPSVQDRPLIPTCYVLLGDLPQEVKTVFRKWTSPRTTSGKDQLCVRIEEVAQELGIAL